MQRIAGRLGFQGQVEYRHVYSQSGGAQYCLASTPGRDLPVVYAEAFDRDANPEDFSLEAILAHERGHQLLARHARLAKQVAGKLSPISEEILASVLGALLCSPGLDRDALLAKATVELVNCGEPPGPAARRIQQLSDLLEALL